LSAVVDFTKSSIEVGPPGASDAGAGEKEPRASARADVVPGAQHPDESSDPGSPTSVRVYAFSPLGEVAQELIVKGGFEAVIAEELEE
ncbi:MAG: hypothetical protein ACE5E1_04625, partial [Phycisphaerae bacterium]